ncbi:hypothetical protein LXA43DRAFT_373352 [Ganoderma leucocontextum]|nr:hypothetical protein LXA43DRAFT_373352 [Ganoderma leucocontextum]
MNTCRVRNMQGVNLDPVAGLLLLCALAIFQSDVHQHFADSQSNWPTDPRADVAPAVILKSHVEVDPLSPWATDAHAHPARHLLIYTIGRVSARNALRNPWWLARSQQDVLEALEVYQECLGEYMSIDIIRTAKGPPIRSSGVRGRHTARLPFVLVDGDATSLIPHPSPRYCASPLPLLPQRQGRGGGSMGRARPRLNLDFVPFPSLELLDGKPPASRGLPCPKRRPRDTSCGFIPMQWTSIALCGYVVSASRYSQTLTWIPSPIND